MANPKTRPIEDSELLKDVLPQYLHRSHLTILTGPPYVGKSRFLEWLAYCAAMGFECFWGIKEPLKVLFCSERSLELIKSHFVGLNLELPDESHLRFFTVGDMTPDQHLRFRSDPLGMVRHIAEQFRPDIVIFDTLVHFLPKCEKGNVNDYGSMAERIMFLQVWTYSLKVGSIASHHTGKEKEGYGYAKVLDKTLGSQAIVGNTTSAWNLSEAAEPEDDGIVYLKLQAKTHVHLAPPDIYFKVAPNATIEVCDRDEVPFLKTPPISEKETPLQHAILELVPNGGTEVLRAELVKLVKFKIQADPHNVHKAINKMVNKGVLVERKEGFRNYFLKRSDVVH